MANVLTSENSAEFYANKLGLAEDSEAVATEEVEPVQDIEQSEPVEANEEKATDEPKPNPKVKMRFDEVTKQRDLARQETEQARQKAIELEQELRSYKSQAEPKKEQSRDERPKPDQFVDAFEYAEALADWSAENAVMRARQEDVERKLQAERDKLIVSWNQKLEATKSELPDFDEMVASTDVRVSDQVRDAILESDVGPRILYHLAENPEIAQKIADSSLITALREIGKLEARFEKAEQKEMKPVVVKSKAPAPISPIKAGTSEQVIVTDTDKMTFAQYKAMRQAKRIR